MNRSPIAVTAMGFARILAASISLFLLWAPCWNKSLGDPGPPQAGPAESAPTSAGAGEVKQVAHQPPAALQAQAGMRVERQVLSPSGKLRIEYMRDRQKGLRQIALQDAQNPANTTVLAQYKRNAWVVLSPNDEWLVLNNRDGAAGGGQLYHRVSTAPLKYEVPADLRGAGGALQDVVWQTYLNDTQQDPNTDRSQVTIDGLSWEPDSQRVTLSVAPVPTKSDAALPEPWTCVYNVTQQQIEPPADVAQAPSDGPPNESQAAPIEESAPEETQAAPAGDDSADLEGEKFPATREQEITTADANELELSDIRYAINEMLARHGMTFKDAKTRKTFEEFSWYQARPDVSTEDIEKEFSPIEKHNFAVLRRVRDAKVAATHRQERRPIKGEPVQDEDAQRALRGFLQGVSDALNGGN